jgi:peptide deformylase
MRRPRKSPAYVDIHLTKNKTRIARLRRACPEVTFPLSENDQWLLKILEDKYDNQKNCVGLAAPQIGIRRQMIVFAVDKNDPRLGNRIVTMDMGRVVWLNPSYTPLTEEMQEDYEACFSVMKTRVFGLVRRPQRIAYEATLPDGSRVEGEATDFLARVIMHEIDHVKGMLFVDKADDQTVFHYDSDKKLDVKRKRLYKEWCNINDAASAK